MELATLLTQQFQPLLQELKLINGRLEGIEGRLGKLETRIGNLELRMSKLESRMDKLESRMDQLEAKMDQLEVRVERLEHEFIGFKVSVNKRLTALEESLWTTRQLVEMHHQDSKRQVEELASMVYEHFYTKTEIKQFLKLPA